MIPTEINDRKRKKGRNGWWIVEKRAGSSGTREDCSRPICFVRGVCVGCVTALSLAREVNSQFRFSILSLRVREMIDSISRKIFVRSWFIFSFYFVKRKEEEKKKRTKKGKSETKSRNFYNFNAIGNDWRFCDKYSVDFEGSFMVLILISSFRDKWFWLDSL